jgi:hypothetical protein
MIERRDRSPKDAHSDSTGLRQDRPQQQRTIKTGRTCDQDHPKEPRSRGASSAFPL